MSVLYFELITSFVTKSQFDSTRSASVVIDHVRVEYPARAAGEAAEQIRDLAANLLDRPPRFELDVSPGLLEQLLALVLRLLGGFPLVHFARLAGPGG